MEHDAAAEPMDLEAAFASLSEREARRQGESRARLRGLCDELRQRGIARVVVPYNGYGDSGCIETASAFDAQENQLPLDDPHDDLLQECVATLLPPGWEINEGAFGEMILDVAKRSLLRAHHWRVEATEYDEETIEL